MPALDTNVLIRHIVRDDAAEFAAAGRLTRRGVAEGKTLHVPVTVFLELEWVLRSSFESETALALALARYAESSAHFPDCLHVALAIQAGHPPHPPLWTFDKGAARIPGARRLRS